MKTTHINASANKDGSRNVSYLSEREGWIPAGRLMPEVKNHTPEQPTNRWKKHMQERVRTDHDAITQRARRTQYHA